MNENSKNSSLTEDELDVTLMLQAQTGCMSAFEQIVERHQHTVIGTVTKMLGNNKDSQDISQQVFIRLWKSAPKYQRKAKFTTYLYTITRNLVFNEIQKRDRRKTSSLDEREEIHHIEAESSPKNSPSNQILEVEMHKAIDKAIQNLPEKQRMAIVLRRYELLPYEEISSILGLSLSALKSQLFRARNSLRESLREYLDQ